MNTRTLTRLALGLAGTLACSLSVMGQLSIPEADGSDGVFAPTTNTVVDLSLATSGNWDQNNGTNSGKGVYDSSKWAVVFKYTSVNIPAGVTVTFKNHASRAPVVWLVASNVDVTGKLKLNGKNNGGLLLTEPGPGGFRGGVGNLSAANLSGAGLGPGGGGIGFRGGPGLYATEGTTVGEGKGSTYGNSRIVPLIGGSGAGGYRGNGYGDSNPSGGAGGGAILIAARGSITIDGEVTADSELGVDTGSNYRMAGGSGGAIRLLGARIGGNGRISARSENYFNDIGGNGRIRLEGGSFFGSLITLPFSSSIQISGAPDIWPAPDSPTVRIKSVSGMDAPTEPLASMDFRPTDISYSVSGNTEIILETKNLPTSQPSQVTVRIVPKFGSPLTAIAAHQSGDFASSTWVATVPIPIGPAAIQARVVGPP